MVLQNDASAHVTRWGGAERLRRSFIPKYESASETPQKHQLAKLSSFSVSVSKCDSLRYNEMLVCLFHIQ